MLCLSCSASGNPDSLAILNLSKSSLNLLVCFSVGHLSFWVLHRNSGKKYLWKKGEWELLKGVGQSQGIPLYKSAFPCCFSENKTTVHMSSPHFCVVSENKQFISKTKEDTEIKTFFSHSLVSPSWKNVNVLKFKITSCLRGNFRRVPLKCNPSSLHYYILERHWSNFALGTVAGWGSSSVFEWWPGRARGTGCDRDPCRMEPLLVPQRMGCVNSSRSHFSFTPYLNSWSSSVPPRKDHLKNVRSGWKARSAQQVEQAEISWQKQQLMLDLSPVPLSPSALRSGLRHS